MSKFEGLLLTQKPYCYVVLAFVLPSNYYFYLGNILGYNLPHCGVPFSYVSEYSNEGEMASSLIAEDRLPNIEVFMVGLTDKP